MWRGTGITTVFDEAMLRNRGLLTTILLIALAGVNIVLTVWWWGTSDDIARESGPIENLQLVMLAAAAFVFAQGGRKGDDVLRPFLFCCCMASIYLLFREIDFRTMPVSDWVRMLSSGVMRKTIQGIILLLLAGYALLNFGAIRSAVSRMSAGECWPYVCVFALFALSKGAEEISRADKNPVGDFALPHGQVWEEMLELNADMMLLVAALLSYGVMTSAMRRVRGPV